MTLDSSKVNVAVTGAVKFAEVDVDAPEDAEEALGDDWNDVGYISEDGVVETRDRSTNDIPAWQNGDIVRTRVTEASISVSFTMIETNKNSLELFYGRAIDPEDGSIEIEPAETGGRRALAVDYVDGDRYVRLYLPQAEVSEVGEVELTSSDAVGYEVTVVGYRDKDLNYSAKKWFSDLVEES